MLRKDDRQILGLLKLGPRTLADLMIRVYDNRLGSDVHVKRAVTRLTNLGAPIHYDDGKYQLYSEDFELRKRKLTAKSKTGKARGKPKNRYYGMPDRILEYLNPSPRSVDDIRRHLFSSDSEKLAKSKIYNAISYLRNKGYTIEFKNGEYYYHNVDDPKSQKPTLTKLPAAKVESPRCGAGKDTAVELVKLLRDTPESERTFAIKMAAAMYEVEL